jgi:hypothetical protein
MKTMKKQATELPMPPKRDAAYKYRNRCMVSFPDILYKRYQQAAKAESLTFQDFIRRATEHYYKAMEAAQKQ